jgi:CRP/FNR family cyclic AMP-dependent transcriptional regulator
MEAGDLLKQTPLFAELSDDDISKLSPSTRVETHPPGHVILREGRVGTAFYLVVSGQVEVVKGLAGPEPKVVAKLGPGDFFGEIAALIHVTRSASVRAVVETKCLVIHRMDLDSFIERYPDITAKVEFAIATRFGKET